MIDLHRQPTPLMAGDTTRGASMTSELQREIAEWSRETFPSQTDARLILHIHEEATELETAVGAALPDPDQIADELGDLAVLMIALADRHAIDLEVAIRETHHRNQRRSFAFDPETGYDRHTDEEGS